MIRIMLYSPPFRTSAKVRYVKARLTGNAAAGNAYNVADMASLLQAVRNAGANNVVILGALSWQCARCTRATSSQWVASVNNISTLASRLNGLSIAAVAASSHSYDLTKPPAARGQALARVTADDACRRRQKKYESPQSTPVAAAQPHAPGPSPTAK